jgi:hypothetical protein
VSDLWLPPGAVPFSDDVERVIADSVDPAAARRLAEELREQGVEFATDAMFGSAIANASDPGQIKFKRCCGA